MPPKLPRGAGCLWSLIWHTLSSKVLSVLSCCAGHRVIHWSYSMFTEGPSLWCLASASCPIALVTFQVCWGHGQGSLTHQSVFSFCPWWPLALLVGEPSQQTLYSSPPSDLTGSFNLWGHFSPTHQLSHWSWESSLSCLSCFGPEGTTLWKNRSRPSSTPTFPLPPHSPNNWSGLIFSTVFSKKERKAKPLRLYFIL